MPSETYPWPKIVHLLSMQCIPMITTILRMLALRRARMQKQTRHRADFTHSAPVKANMRYNSTKSVQRMHFSGYRHSEFVRLSPR